MSCCSNRIIASTLDRVEQVCGFLALHKLTLVCILLDLAEIWRVTDHNYCLLIDFVTFMILHLIVIYYIFSLHLSLCID